MNLNITAILSAFVCLIVVTAGVFSMVAHIDYLQEELDESDEKVRKMLLDEIGYDNDIQVLKDKINYWRELYDSCEAEVIYYNETIYVSVPEYVYISNAIFDVNRDGTVDYNDACEVLWYIQKGVSIIEDWVFDRYGNPYEKLYDVNRDGRVDNDDVGLIWEYCD